VFGIWLIKIYSVGHSGFDETNDPLLKTSYWSTNGLTSWPRSYSVASDWFSWFAVHSLLGWTLPRLCLERLCLCLLWLSASPLSWRLLLLPLMREGGRERRRSHDLKIYNGYIRWFAHSNEYHFCKPFCVCVRVILHAVGL